MLSYVRRSAYLLSLVLLVAILSACKMGPNYLRPETPKADAWRVPTSTAESSSRTRTQANPTPRL